MLARSWIALLLLVNYLLVAGMGCISQPEDQQEFVLVQTKVAGHDYQQCRFLRMDGLEDFLNEALATRYQNSTEKTVPHHLISVVNGIDAHHLPDLAWPLPTPVCQSVATPSDNYHYTSSSGIGRAVYPPPRLG